MPGRPSTRDMRYIWLIPLLPGIGAAINGLVGHPFVLAQDSPARRVHDDGGGARPVARRVLAVARRCRPRRARSTSRRAVDSVDSAAAGQRRVGGFQVPWGFRLDPLSGDDAAGRHRHRHADPHLLDRVHGRRAARRRRALLLLSEPVLLLHAHARAGQQLPGDVRGLGRRRPLLVSADRLLVREEERGATPAKKPSSPTASATGASSSASS